MKGISENEKRKGVKKDLEIDTTDNDDEKDSIEASARR